MAADCVQTVNQGERSKLLKTMTSKNVPPTKSLCQPFTLRLILGVPILKEDNKVITDMFNLFTKYANGPNVPQGDGSALSVEREIFWQHIVLGVNSIVKRMEDSARDTETSAVADFAVVFLDFAWLNSQLGHHLAHLCSTTPHTSLLAISPPGKLASMVSTPGRPIAKVACIGIRPLLLPYSIRLPVLRECMKICSSLTGKSLPPDSASGNTATPATPQYVPILPKPTGLEPMSQISGFLNQSPMLPIVTSDVTSSQANTVRKSQIPPTTPTALNQPGSSQASTQKLQVPPKSATPRPAIRHIPADDWLTYKLDHAKLYKCGSDISKELEDHSLYIHDVADIWALYPRHFQKLEARRPPQKKMKPKVPPSPPSRKRYHAPVDAYSDAYMDSSRRLSRDERHERIYAKQMAMKRSRQQHNPRRSPRSYSSRIGY